MDYYFGAHSKKTLGEVRTWALNKNAEEKRTHVQYYYLDYSKLLLYVFTTPSKMD